MLVKGPKTLHSCSASHSLAIFLNCGTVSTGTFLVYAFTLRFLSSVIKTTFLWIVIGLFSVKNNNLLSYECEGRTGKYWPEVVTVQNKCSEVRPKTTEGQYSPVRLQQATGQQILSFIIWRRVFYWELNHS